MKNIGRHNSQINIATYLHINFKLPSTHNKISLQFNVILKITLNIPPQKKLWKSFVI